MRCLRWFIASSAVAVFALSVGCIAMQEFPSPPSGEGYAVETTPDSVVDTWPLRDYVLDDAESLVVKIRPVAWPALRDGLSGAGASVPRELPDWLATLTGESASIDGVDGERAAFVMIESPAHTPWMACLEAGLPCPLIGTPPPLWGRLLIPAESGRLKALEASLRRVLGPPKGYRIITHETYVRVEFTVGAESMALELREELERRAAYQPDPRGARTTPAKQAFMDHRGALAMHGSLHQMQQMERYIESVLWHRSVGASPPDQRWALGLKVERGSHGVGATPDPGALFEDIAVLVGGVDASSGVRSDILATRTRRGREALAEGRRLEIPSPEIVSLLGTLEEMTTGVAFRVAAQVDDVVETLRRQPTIRRVTSSEKAWQGMRAEVGTPAPSVVPIDGPSESMTFRQPSTNCLGQGALTLLESMDGDLEEPKDFVQMSNAMTAASGRFERRMTECSGADLMEQERIAWAVAAFDLWRGLLVWRSGNHEWSRQLVSRSCDAGLTWACDVDRTTWPWADAAPRAAR
jgi:hypothetical protein